MKLVLFLSSVLIASTSANSKDCSIVMPEWHPTNPGDSSSPCPILNSLRNHGKLNDGRGITNEQLKSSLISIGVSSFIAKTLTDGGMKLGRTGPDGVQTLDLEDLRLHNAIEHDASLSREDAYFGDNWSFKQAHFDQALQFMSPGLSLDGAAEWRKLLKKQCFESNPECTFGLKQNFAANGEMAMIYLLLKNENDEIPLNVLKDLFEKEKLPDSLPCGRVTQTGVLSTIAKLKWRGA